MIQGHDIVCFSNDWEQDPLSKHHIMSRLARKNRILWINSIGLRRPRMAAQDAAKAWNKLNSFLRKRIYRPQDKLYVANLLALPFHGHPANDVINERLLTFQLKQILAILGFRNPIIWTFLPNITRLMPHFNRRLLVYYITDDFTQFTGHPSQSVAEMEERLMDSAQVVIASAQRLAERKACGKKQIFVVSHGVDHGHFSRALDISATEHPQDIKFIKKPIIGFYGEINDWLDLGLLAEAARKRPDWSFVLLGRIAVEIGNIKYLTDLPNVHWLGQKKYAELPSYCAAFDVALIPMKINELTLNVNPLKLREYLAAGVPVVAAPLPEVQRYRDVVRFAATADELICEIEKILSRPKGFWSKHLSDRVADEDWDTKVEEISSIIERALC